ncbi:hypothetical protein AB0E56_03065 [Microbacterium sp. NPDC028030]|uniref:hypothetical protein n=1 Tax=Microbacterium sp. NPDC028030 TaxID=3155124 RepID=UPI0033E53DE5
MNTLLILIGVLLIASPAVLLVLLLVIVVRFRENAYAELRALRNGVSRRTDNALGSKER